MVRRRTQKVRHFKTGGAVTVDDVLPGFGREEDEAAPPAPEIAPAAAKPEPDDAVARALEAQRRAEQLQAEMRQPEQPAPQHQQPRPSMSERRARFVQQNPELADAANAEAVLGYWKQGQRIGYAEDSADLDDYVLHALHWERAMREGRQEELAGRHAGGMVQAAETEPTHGAPAQAPREAFQEEPAPSMPEPRRSMPMAAPVQREVPNYSGKRDNGGSLHLTEEERRTARNSFMDRPDLPKLTDAQKEYLYAKNKAKYEQMKRDGTYSEQRQR